MPISNGFPTVEISLDSILDYKTELDILNFYIGVEDLNSDRLLLMKEQEEQTEC